MTTKPTLLKQCIDILQTSEVKKELKHLFSPIIDLILYEIYPYIYLILFLVFLIFLLILAILVILVCLLRIGGMAFQKTSLINLV